MQHRPHVAGRALEVRLGDQLAGGEFQRLLEPAELFVAGGIGDAAGLDQRQVGLGNGRFAGELVQRKAEPATAVADFGAEGFHNRSGGLPYKTRTDNFTNIQPSQKRQVKYRTEA